jgi:hypothetical protein
MARIGELDGRSFRKPRWTYQAWRIHGRVLSAEAVIVNAGSNRPESIAGELTQFNSVFNDHSWMAE